MIYVDDSGSVDHGGLIVYGWVEVAPADWRIALRRWLSLRKDLFVDYGIPVSSELHTTEYANGRKSISVNVPSRFIDHSSGTTLKKDLGREVARRCLETLRDCAEIRTGAVYRWSGNTGTAYALDRYDVYRELVERFDRELAAADSFEFITMDGDDPHYRDSHRSLKLDTRHVIEDPAYHDSKHSQWTQMADLVAYAANVNLNPYPGNKFGWDWYQDFLAGSDAAGGPQPCCDRHQKQLDPPGHE
jgi:hypothetical protein